MSKTKSKQAIKVTPLKNFDTKTIKFSDDFVKVKSKFVEKTLGITNKEGEKICFSSKVRKFSAGLKKFENNKWSFHLGFGPTRDMEEGTEEYKEAKRELKTMLEIKRLIKERINKEIKDRNFIFLKQMEGGDIFLNMKVSLGTTAIKLIDEEGNKQIFKKSSSFEDLEDTLLLASSVRFIIDGVIVCKETISVNVVLIGFSGEKLRKAYDDVGAFTDSEDQEEDEAISKN